MASQTSKAGLLESAFGHVQVRGWEDANSLSLLENEVEALK